MSVCERVVRPVETGLFLIAEHRGVTWLAGARPGWARLGPDQDGIVLCGVFRGPRGGRKSLCVEHGKKEDVAARLLLRYDMAEDDDGT